MELLNILEKCNLFNNIDSSDIGSILNCLNYKINKYDSGNIIFLPNDRIDSIGVVLNGKLQITKEDSFGNSFILSKLSTSDIFGEALACSDTVESPVCVTSIENSTILFIPYKNIINTCSKTCKFHTQLISNLLKLIANKNIFLNNRIELLTCKTIREKLYYYFNNQINLYKSNKFKIPFSRQELADFLNVNRSALSRELSNMQTEGLIKFNNNIFEIISL